MSKANSVRKLCPADLECRYPPKMIPGCHILVKTTANTDREARLLLSSLGMPFYGKLRN